MKFRVTPELSTVIKMLRLQNNVSAKELAEYLGKSPSYISKLEGGDVKTIQKADLMEILTFISEGEDFYEDVLAGVVKTLNSFMDPAKMVDQIWLLQCDIVDRPIAVPAAMVDYANGKLDQLGITVEQLVDFINKNVDSEMSGAFPVNEVVAMDYEGKSRILIRVRLEAEQLKQLLNKKTQTTSYLTITNIAFTLDRLETYGADLRKMPPEEATIVLRDVAAYMEQFNIHSLTGFSHMLSSEAFIQQQEALAYGTFSSAKTETINTIVELFNEASTHDSLNTAKMLNTYVDTLNWDPAFALKLLGLPFSKLEGMSFQQKKNLLDEIYALVDKYDNLSDFDKKYESY